MSKKETKIVFETFKDLSGSYSLNSLSQEDPSCINNLLYRKYRVTIELIEEPKEILIERLKALYRNTDNHYHKRPIEVELKKLGAEI